MSSPIRPPAPPPLTHDSAPTDLLQLVRSALLPEHRDRHFVRVSDLHIKTGQPIRYRLDGEIEVLADCPPLTERQVSALLEPFLGPARLAQLNKVPPADVDVGTSLQDCPDVRLRLNVFRDTDGLAAVVRVLDSALPGLLELGLPSGEVVDQLLNLRRGLVLVVGMAGTGKSTTVASLLRQLGTRRKLRIITLEDPVEHAIPQGASLVSQREVGLHVATFADGLRSALRENPDVIFVGEIRDAETAALALTAAETGHLVISTLHARDAIGAVSRLVDLAPSDRLREMQSQLALGLSHVLAQRLVPSKNGEGRHLAVEVLRNVHACGHLIRSGQWHGLRTLMETRGADGMCTMEQALLNLCRADLIRGEDAVRESNDPAAMQRLLAAR